MTDARRAGVVVLLLLLAGAIAAAALPQLGAIRLAGVGLAWWYGLVAAPLLAVLTTLLLYRRGSHAVAAWMSPALVGALLAGVFAGEPTAPVLALLGAAAPLFAPLASRPVGGQDRITVALNAASAGLVLGGSVLVVADVARLVGAERWPALGLAAGLVAVALLMPPLAPCALALGTLALAVPLVAIPVLGGPSPWSAWTALAARPALVFAETSTGATQGVSLLEPTALAFSEPHRVTALNEGLYRIVAREGDREAVREWRLARGDVLTLRPGDRLDLAAGMSVRFEPGRRVPGAAPSGAAWAGARGVDPVADAANVLGAAVSLAGGAAVLLGRTRPREEKSPGRAARVAGVLAAVAPWVLVLVAVCAGVYAAFAGPDLALGAPAIAPLVGLPAVLPGAPWDRLLVAATLVGMAALLVATAAGLRRQIVPHRTVRALRTPEFWILTAAAAAVAVAGPDNPWRALSLGCGLAASAVAAPALAGVATPARLAGAIAGAGAFAALALGFGGFGSIEPIAAYPALVAAPLAFGVARLGGRWTAKRNRSRSVAAPRQG